MIVSDFRKVKGKNLISQIKQGTCGILLQPETRQLPCGRRSRSSKRLDLRRYEKEMRFAHDGGMFIRIT